MSKNTQNIRRAQKESFFFKEIAQFFLQITLQDPRLSGIYVNRVSLSPDGGSCEVLFLAHNGKEEFDQKIGFLLAYKGALRTALAKTSQGRYVPKLVFNYDVLFEKQERVNILIDELKREGKL
jgi:ribosome-binding factor A